MIFELLFTAIAIFIVTSVAELVTAPLVGTLVRFRANYAPKGLQLDQEGGVQPHAGPVVNSYFAMMKRVLDLEGWKGMYKGFMPSIISTFVITIFTWIYIGSLVPRGQGRYSAPAATPFQLLVYTVFVTVVGLPFIILVDRAITTPYLLPWTSPMYSLRRLFTPTELRKPWLLYLTPGLLSAKLLHLGYIVLVLKSFRSLLLPSADAIGSGNIPPGSGMPSDFTPLRISTYLVLAALSTGVLCPLEVIATRLALQRNHATGGAATFEAVPQEDPGVVDDDAQFAGTEDVIGLRSEFDPYVSFRDAAKRMVDEEGWKALYRGWWITLLASLMGAFV